MSADLLSCLSELGPWPEKPRAPATSPSVRAARTPVPLPASTLIPLPAQEGGGTATGASPSGKSNAALPASVDAHVNDGRPAAEAGNEVVTGGESAATSFPIPSLSLMQTQVDGQLAGSAPFLPAPPALSGAAQHAPGYTPDRFPFAGERDVRAIFSAHLAFPGMRAVMRGRTVVIHRKTRPLQFLALLCRQAGERFVRVVVKSLRRASLHGNHHAERIVGNVRKALGNLHHV